jgi:glycosyltransferase involved in cell wall biosynthesis
MALPRVSVCIPLFNGAATIVQLLQSIRDQSFTDFHVLLADDASTDATVAVIAPFLDDARFQLIRREKNVGFFANLIQLIAAAPASDFLIFPGQDDVWLPGLLEKHVTFLAENPQAGVVHSRCTLIDEKGSPIERRQWYWERLSKMMSGAELIEALLTHNFVCLPAATVRRIAFDDVKKEFLSEKFTYVPDWWLWLLIAGRGWSFGYLPEPDCRYRLHTEQLTQTLPAGFKTVETSMVLFDFTALLDGERFGRSLTRRRRKILKRLARARLMRRGLGMIWRNESTKQGRQLLQAAWKDDPLSVFLFPVFFCRYLAAKLTQHNECSGMPEIFHPLGKR